MLQIIASHFLQTAAIALIVILDRQNNPVLSSSTNRKGTPLLLVAIVLLVEV
jgi:hypothetical protein